MSFAGQAEGTRRLWVSVPKPESCCPPDLGVQGSVSNMSCAAVVQNKTFPCQVPGHKLRYCQRKEGLGESKEHLSPVLGWGISCSGAGGCKPRLGGIYCYINRFWEGKEKKKKKRIRNKKQRIIESEEERKKGRKI